METLYSTTARATGDGRNGRVQSTDGILDQQVRVPEAMGGAGGATNPEQLFAAGYAACFHSALRIVASRSDLDVADSEVTATVHIGPGDGPGYELAVEVAVHLPGADEDQAREAVDQAHQVCPYSNATRGNIEVTLTVV